MRRSILNIIILFFAFVFTINVAAQSTSVTDRTPEQEATKQTEKLQQELNLTTQQAKDIYDINLKYARERKQSNKRTDAMNRIKKKNEEINKVLNNRQKEELRTRRSTVQSVEIDGERRYSRTDSRGRVENTRRSSATSAPSAARSQDRPVRSDFNSRQPLNSSGRESRATTDRPVRNNGTLERSQTDTRTRDNNVRENRTAPTNRTDVQRSSPVRTNESRSSSSTRESRSEPQRSSRESGTRR